MFPYLLIYLSIGVILNLIIDILCHYLDTPNKFSIIERVLVGILWPWSMVKLISEYWKQIK